MVETRGRRCLMFSQTSSATSLCRPGRTPTSTQRASEASPLALPSGVADVYGTGRTDHTSVRDRYTDGTSTDAASAIAQTLLGSGWSRLVVPATQTLDNRMIVIVNLHLVRTSTSGSSWTPNVDNAKVIEIQSDRILSLAHPRPGR